MAIEILEFVVWLAIGLLGSESPEQQAIRRKKDLDLGKGMQGRRNNDNEQEKRGSWVR